MLEIGSYDAKTKLPEILRKVEAGESFRITNRGKPVADLVPVQNNREQIKSAIDNILRTKRDIEVSDEELDELKSSGRK